MMETKPQIWVDGRLSTKSDEMVTATETMNRNVMTDAKR